jgi:hypothetical protein
MDILVCRQPIDTHNIDYTGYVCNIKSIRRMKIGWLKLLEAEGMPVTNPMERGMLPTLAQMSIELWVSPSCDWLRLSWVSVVTQVSGSCGLWCTESTVH